MSQEHTDKIEYQPTSQKGLELFTVGLLESLQEQKLRITTWEHISPTVIYDELEHPNWAPWLEASVESIVGRASFFPEGQLLIVDEQDQPVASLSTNRIDWDGNLDTLPTWDDIAGTPSDFSQTYRPKGDTLVLMSMNVHSSQKGKQLPTKLVHQAQLMAHNLGIRHLIGSFRPNEYGQYKQKSGQNIDFWEYATQLKTPKVDSAGVFGQKNQVVQVPIDGWLRSLTWLGMKPIKEDKTAMTVCVSIEEFLQYKETYHPKSWWQDATGVWHCSEVGSWSIDEAAGLATYQESNLYGRLPLLFDGFSEGAV